MRVTEKQLQAIVDRINDLTGSPMTSYTVNKQGKYTANIGNYHLSDAYGEWQLQRKGGGVEAITSGFVSKRELANLMWQYIAGIEVNREK